jgi:integrase
VGSVVHQSGDRVVRHKLTVKQIAALTAKGRYGDGGGLWLQVSGSGKSWLFRYMRNGRAHAMGLGPYPEISLADARDRAFAARRLIKRDGIDPLEQRQAVRAAAKPAAVHRLTFRECAEAYLATNSKWRNAKHAAQWRTTLETYVYPVLGPMPVAEVDTAAVLRVLEPIWWTKTETASRIRGRIEKVLAWATVKGHRSGDNPARWTGHLKEALPARMEIAPVNHHRALPYAGVPAFMAELARRTGMAARCLEFTILTAARSGEAIGARWSEIDLTARTWMIPAERMKAGQLHVVPLSDRVLELLSMLPRSSDLVFEGARVSRPICDVAMTMVLRRMGRRDITVHGFRSAFRDWAAELTDHQNHVVEMALAHRIGDKVEAAYRRGELLAKRRKLMAAWAAWCGS